MGEKKWTPQQLQAIHARGGKLLVSAAAGSGKTAVLVERVISRLIDERSPIDADRLLVVTFSNAAALEMRQRVMARLDELLRQSPGDARLLRQQTLMQQSHIGTIHSFCLEIIRSNFQQLGLPPSMRTGDEKELALLRRSCAETVIERFLQGEQRASFQELTELLSVGRDDTNVFATLFSLYDFVRSHPFYLDWLDEKLALYDPATPPGDSPWGRCILDYAGQALNHACRLLLDAISAMEDDEELSAAYRDALCDDLDQAQNLVTLVSNDDWDGVCSALESCGFTRLRAYRGQSEDKEYVTGLRKQAREVVEGLRDKYFCSTSEEYAEDMSELRPIVSVLFELMKEFDREFTAQKQSRYMLDFSDMEQYALALLVSHIADGGYEPTKLARQIASGFDEIMIDEYQDTNEAQEMVFRAVSHDDDNMFLVGDVKQSIYRFRQACPELFMEKKRRFSPYDGVSWPAKIILGKNFRSAKQVTGAVNFFFSLLMSDEIGEISYDADEALDSAATFAENPDGFKRGCSLHILDTQNLPSPSDAAAVEADYAAGLIADMLSRGTPVTEDGKIRRACPRDFCILLRSQAGKAAVYQQALERRGVPAWSDAKGGFLMSREIAPVVSLLRVLENPLLDVELTCALLSPLFSFTPDELAAVRLARRGVPLYLALTRHADSGDEKSAGCIKTLDELRRFAANETASEVIRHILEKTGYEQKVLVMPLGQARRQNLQLLTYYAQSYHQSGYRGISGLLGFLDKLQEHGGDLDPASASNEQADVVRIMTIHHSKGLEFPFVLLCDCAKRFNRTDLASNTLLHSRLGFACVRRDLLLMKQFTTVPMQAIKLELERSMLSEELRVLYVALTRAKEKIFLIGSVKNPGDRLNKLDGALSKTKKLFAHQVRGASSYFDWLLMALLHHPACRFELEERGMASRRHANDIKAFYDNTPLEMVLAEPTGALFEPSTAQKQLAEPPAELVDQLKRQISFCYPYASQTAIPTKMGVSQLSKEQGTSQYRFARRPVFMEEGGMSAAQKGSALHKFMQFADYSRAAADLHGELARMCDKGFLSRAETECINESLLSRFFSGELAARIFASPRVLRELRFLAEAGEELIGQYTPLMQDAQGGKTAIQGVADCVFFEDNQAVIVDYKTDRVKSAQTLLERYRVQMELYRALLQKSLDAPVKQCLIYSFALGESIVVE